MRVLGTLHDWIDVRSGLIGGSLLGTIVWFINAEHGVFGATTAAVKQFAYTFCMGSLIMRLCTRLALRPGRGARVITTAVYVPTLVTVGTTFLVHSLRGTPEPLLSTVPAALLSPLGFAFWARRVRREGRSPWESAADIGGKTDDATGAANDAT
jgi:hypothetical protein